MSLIEKRLSALEAARGDRFRKRGGLVIFDGDAAEIHTDIPPYSPYQRQRHSGESADVFQRRVMAEAGEYGPKPISMTRQKYEEIAARLDAEI